MFDLPMPRLAVVIVVDPAAVVDPVTTDVRRR
jgi:hypothetical protein